MPPHILLYLLLDTMSSGKWAENARTHVMQVTEETLARVKGTWRKFGPAQQS